MKYVKLGELCSMITDGTHQTPIYSENGYKFLSSKDVTTGKIDWSSIKYIGEDLHQQLSKRLKPQRNDILLAKNGTTGIAALVDIDEIFDIYVSLALLRPKEIVYPPYLLSVINSPYAKRQFNKGLKGIGVPNLHLSVIREVDVPLPSMIIQKKIAEITKKAQVLLNKRRQQIEACDGLIKSRFVEMFGDISTGQYKYETLKLGDIANVGSSHRVFTTEFVEEGIPFYRGTEIGKLANGQQPSDPYYISEEHYQRLANDGTKPKVGDLLMPSICNKGQVWMVDTEEPFYYKDGRVLCISADREIYDTRYLQFFIRLKTEIEYPKLGSGSTFAEFKIFLLKDIDVLTPPRKMQNQFATFVQQVDKLKFTLQKSLLEMEDNFNVLMQKAFNGELFPED